MPSRLDARYRAAVRRLRDQIALRLNRIYGTSIRGDDLDAEFRRFFGPAAALVHAGQAQGAALAAGYLSSLITLQARRTARLPVLTLPSLTDIRQRMDAFPALVKAQIAEGRPLAEALASGHFYAERFTDAELTSVIDAQTELATKRSGQFRGWEGVVDPDSCDPCKDNLGFHPIGEEPYRHGYCNCMVEYIVA